MDTLYQSLVTVNPVTLIAQICNLFLQLLVFKIFFLDKIKAILDQRREAADKQITEAENAKAEAMTIKKTYEQNMLQAKAKADDLLQTAQRTANSRSEEIIAQAQQQAAQIKSKAADDIALEKKKASNEAKDEISDLAMAIAGKVVGRELNAGDQAEMIDRFIDELGDNVCRKWEMFTANPCTPLPGRKTSPSKSVGNWPHCATAFARSRNLSGCSPLPA